MIAQSWIDLAFPPRASLVQPAPARAESFTAPPGNPVVTFDSLPLPEIGGFQVVPGRQTFRQLPVALN